MRNIMIVDDEPISADGAKAYLEDHGDEEWLIQCSYSANGALLLMKQARVDVLIVDIFMPDMDGFALIHEISGRWPDMKVVIMTGNPMVDNAQRAIRTDLVVDYIVKTERMDALVLAVRKAIHLLTEREKRMDLSKLAAQQIQKALPLLQNELLNRLLCGQIDFANRIPETNADFIGQLQARFDEVSLPFSASSPVFLIATAFLRDAESAMENERMQFALESVVHRHLSAMFSVKSLSIGRDFALPKRGEEKVRVLFVVQADATRLPESESASYLFASLDAVQQDFERLYCRVFMVLSDACVSWRTLNLKAAYLLRALNAARRESGCKDMEAQDSGLIRLREEPAAPEDTRSDVDAIRVLMERGDGIRAAAMVKSFLTEGPRTSYGKADLYGELIKLFSAQMALNGSGEEEETAFFAMLPALCVDDTGWKQTLFAFSNIAVRLTESISQIRDRQTGAFAERATCYIEAHLTEDLPLVSAAAYMGQSPAYFSRQFKRAVGVGFSKYVVNRRMELAQKLLTDTNLTVGDIARKCGYYSLSYLIRQFRAYSGLTPNEYRALSQSHS